LQAFGDSSLLIEKYFDQYTFLVFCWCIVICCCEFVNLRIRKTNEQFFCVCTQSQAYWNTNPWRCLWKCYTSFWTRLFCSTSTSKNHWSTFTQLYIHFILPLFLFLFLLLLCTTLKLFVVDNVGNSFTCDDWRTERANGKHRVWNWTCNWILGYSFSNSNRQYSPLAHVKIVFVHSFGVILRCGNCWVYFWWDDITILLFGSEHAPSSRTSNHWSNHWYVLFEGSLHCLFFLIWNVSDFFFLSLSLC
jgi:hypothetical protein